MHKRCCQTIVVLKSARTKRLVSLVFPISLCSGGASCLAFLDVYPIDFLLTPQLIPNRLLQLLLAAAPYTGFILGYFDTEGPQSWLDYQNYVKEKVNGGYIDPLAGVVASTMLGSEDYLRKI